MGLIWDHAFGPQQLAVDPAECRILLTDPAMNPTANRQQMLEVMFGGWRWWPACPCVGGRGDGGL